MLKIIASCFVSALVFNASVSAAMTSSVDDQQAVEVTVYNSNIGLVKDIRRLQIPQGVGELKFMDVASSILPYTVQIQSLDSPGSLNILEQNYEYDLMDPAKLLDKYIGKSLKIMTVS